MASNMYATSCSINRTWQNDIKTLKHVINKSDRKDLEIMDQYSNEPWFSNGYNVINNISTEEFIHKYKNKLGDHKNMVAFLWDMTSPIFNNVLDEVYPKFNLLKKACKLSENNMDRLENNRSNNCYIPRFDTTKAMVVESSYFKSGQCVLMNYNNRYTSLLINKLHHRNPIESNMFGIQALERTADPNSTTGCINSELYAKYLKEDTQLNRVQGLQESLKNLITYITALKLEKKAMFSEIFIIVNPILNHNLICVEQMFSILQTLIKKIIIDHYSIGNQLPKINICLLSEKDGFTCDSYYQPKKSIADQASNIVSISIL